MTVRSWKESKTYQHSENLGALWSLKIKRRQIYRCVRGIRFLGIRRHDELSHCLHNPSKWGPKGKDCEVHKVFSQCDKVDEGI
jgi:hypothetical protein